jgi:hypothetical protein
MELGAGRPSPAKAKPQQRLLAASVGLQVMLANGTYMVDVWNQVATWSGPPELHRYGAVEHLGGQLQPQWHASGIVPLSGAFSCCFDLCYLGTLPK